MSSSSSSSAVAQVSIKIDAFCPVGIGGTKGIDTTYLKLFVGGLSPQYSSKDLFDLFSKFGTIRESVVIPDRFRVRSRCYGFVTFVNDKSAQTALATVPIVTEDGAELTVVLASTNTKPRRAHFNVKHGISGHKPLPTVNEEEEEEEEEGKGHVRGRQSGSTSTASLSFVSNGKRGGSQYVRKSVSNIKLTTSTTRGQGKKNGGGNKTSGDGVGNNKVAIYTDPSLFRTANIQQIAPAVFDIDEKATKNKKKSVSTGPWPNEDIKKDYHDLKKVTVSKEQKHNDRKAWKLIASEQEPDRESYYDGASYFNGYGQDALEDEYSTHINDDICSVKSREWTPIASKRSRSKRRHKRRKSPLKRKMYHWNGSAIATAPSSTSSLLSAAASCASSATNHENIKYWQQAAADQDADDEDDRITVSSSVFNAIFDEDMKDEALEDVSIPSKHEDTEVKDDHHHHHHHLASTDAGACSVSSSGVAAAANNVIYGAIPTMNSLWGSYQPAFPQTNGCGDLNFQTMAPTPPVLPVSLPASCPSVKNASSAAERPSYTNSVDNCNVNVNANQSLAINATGVIPDAMHVSATNYSNGNSFQSYMPMMHDPNYLNCYVQPQPQLSQPQLQMQSVYPPQPLTSAYVPNNMNYLSGGNWMPNVATSCSNGMAYVNDNYPSVSNVTATVPPVIYNTNYLYNATMHQSVSNSK